MQVEDVKKVLESHLPGCSIEVQVDGSHYAVTAIGDAFDGLNRVKKQQLVYAALNDYIADGSIHAVDIRTYTQAQWQA